MSEKDTSAKSVNQMVVALRLKLTTSMPGRKVELTNHEISQSFVDRVIRRFTGAMLHTPAPIKILWITGKKPETEFDKQVNDG